MIRLRIAFCLLAGTCLFSIGLRAQAQAPSWRQPGLTYPEAFKHSLAAPSAPVQFLLSPEGRQILRMGTHPLSKALLKWMGESTVGVPDFVARPKKKQQRLAADPIGAGCFATTGTRFNLEPASGDPTTGLNFPLPQNEESVDFLPNGVSAGFDILVEGSNDFRGLFGGLGSSVSGYYVHRTATSNCNNPSFEGGVPGVVDNASGDTLIGMGDPVVAADPARNKVFYAGLGEGLVAEGITLYSTTAPTLLDTTNCASGTHDSIDSATCWPVSTVADSVPFPTSTPLFDDKPHMRVDEAANQAHIGAGDVYVTFTRFNFDGTSTIALVACTNDLSSCSPTEGISGLDVATQFSHLDVRPDGSLAITYINITLAPNVVGRPEREIFTIRYVTCVPNGAPTPPSCSLTPQTVLTDANTIPFASVAGVGGQLAGEGFRVTTYPKHDYQLEPNGHVWEYIVWDRCKVPLLFAAICPDADVLGVAADTGTLGAPSATPSWSHAFSVDTHAGKHDFMPWIRTDASRNIVNIAYYSNFGDSLFNHRPVVVTKQISPCTPTATGCPLGLPSDVFTTLDEPQADNQFFVFGPGFGDYQGVAARGTGTGASRSYFGYTANFRIGLTEGIAVPDEDNYINQFSY